MIPLHPDGIEPSLWLSLLPIPAMTIFFLLLAVRMWRIRRAARRRDRDELRRSAEGSCRGWWA